MTRLVMCSNRFPQGDPPSGGLVFALHDTMYELGGLWIGTNSSEIGDQTRDSHHVSPGDRLDRLTMTLSDTEHQGYYLGHANLVAWPMLHGRIDLLNVNQGQSQIHQAANARLARLAIPHLHPDDTNRIHDYHFIPLVWELRQLGITNAIGFSLHTPFPEAPWACRRSVMFRDSFPPVEISEPPNSSPAAGFGWERICSVSGASRLALMRKLSEEWQKPLAETTRRPCLLTD